MAAVRLPEIEVARWSAHEVLSTTTIWQANGPFLLFLHLHIQQHAVKGFMASHQIYCTN
jgi:hypothetical protein